MHEISIAQSILEMAENEAHANGCNRLLSIQVKYGALAGIMPDALLMGMEALTKGTIHEGVKLELMKQPLVLRCPFCNKIFGAESDAELWEACPDCGEWGSYAVEGGKELILTRLEADSWQLPVSG